MANEIGASVIVPDPRTQRSQTSAQVPPPLVDNLYVAKACYQIVPSYATEPATPYGGLLFWSLSPISPQDTHRVSSSLSAPFHFDDSVKWIFVSYDTKIHLTKYWAVLRSVFDLRARAKTDGEGHSQLAPFALSRIGESLKRFLVVFRR